MKIRTDYVTNSSSSSFIIITKVNKCQELKDYIAEEYGKYGTRLLDERLIKDITHKKEQEDVFLGFDIPEEVLKELDADSYYLVSEHITYTTDGYTEGDDAWLLYHIPEYYKEEVYKSETD